MKLSHFCVDHPVFASVLSILIVLIGAFAFLGLPIAQYPEIAPPTIIVRASYPGANAETIANTVATPLEQEINGVENMLYMQSQSTGDGSLQIAITFDLGTDLDDAQVLVQNRVAVAEPRLPEEVRRLGITVTKSSPDLMMVVHVVSPDASRDQLYLSNYARLQIRDVLTRVDGVGDVQAFGARDYSMRIWLDPERIAARGLTASDVVQAVRAQNVQVASGVLNQPPIPTDAAYQMNIETQGRLQTVDEFENIAVRTDSEGRITRLGDVARVEIGARDYSQVSRLDENEAVALAIFQRPGSNALETAEGVRAALASLAPDFPMGVDYEIVYDTTIFIEESILEVIKTIGEAIILVVLVVILFLQTWRASVIPILAIPVSLVGTFAILSAFGYSLNNLSLFGLVLAIGIVVDDAIVVVENVERHLREGLSPRQAAHRTMDEVSGALISIALVLSAVFIPAAFVGGISGAFFRQFAVTIAAATVISAIVSLTLSPALCAVLLKAHDPNKRDSLLMRPIHGFFRGFDRAFGGLSRGYSGLTRRLVRLPLLVLLVYAALVGVTGWQFNRAPTGFIPTQDQGYLITVVQLPPGASLGRTDEVVLEASEILRSIEGIEHTVAFAGFDGATFTNASNAGAIFSALAPFEERVAAGRSADVIMAETFQKLGGIQEAFILTVPPPPVAGIGNTGGFKMMVQDRRGRGLELLEEATGNLTAAANGDPTVAGAFTLFNTRTPRIYADLDRVRAELLGVPAERLFQTLEIYLGSAYVNDFNILGRTYQVTAQADGQFRQEVEDIADLRTRNEEGEMVPLGAVATFSDTTGPHRVTRFNLYPAAEVQGNSAPMVSTGETLLAMERLAEEILPDGFSYAWTELAYQERQAQGGLMVFGLAVVVVFLLLAAQYESWSLPLAVVLIVPMSVLGGVTGLLIRGLPVDVLAQVGFIVLVGLAAKNAILIVEFARQAEAEGKDRFAAAIEAARTRLRPILMTSFAFILGVVPLVIAQGAGAEMRISLGTAVFSGMLGVTLFGLIFTPVFYTAVRGVTERFRPSARRKATAPA
ncbi:multidrug efflux RND transporter permease subunit [Inquilinus sp. CAU 1745]|uniref:efflux RND transporter permease subunit n=1 Tax=Inquilinus sp. CAU 1745 TaxID=3140369 RepID=UPI00325BA88B